MIQSPKILVELGYALSLGMVDGSRIKFTPNKYLLYSNISGSRLFVLPKPKRRKSRDLDLSDNKVKKGLSLFATFKDCKADKGFLLPDCGLSSAKKQKTKIADIIYRSDKWDTLDDYIHPFEYHPNLWINKLTKACAIFGGKIKITKRGIEG